MIQSVELRELDQTVIADYFKDVKFLSLRVLGADEAQCTEFIESRMLRIYLKFLTCDIFQKKLEGINEINTLIWNV